MNKILKIAAMALMISACSSNDLEETVQQPNNKADGIPFTATIRVGESATTRALTEDGVTIVPSWAEGDKVALIHGSINDEMTVSSVSDGVATITGNITGSPADGAAVTIIYPSSAVDGATGNVKANLLASQDGTLSTIAKNYDVRTGSGTLNVGATETTLYGNVSLTNKFAIVKFSLSDGTNAIKTTLFVIKDGSENVVTTVTPTSANSELYVAMAPATASAFRFEATAATTTYYYDKSGATLTAGTYYQSPMAMTGVTLSTPLTLEAITAGTISVNNPNGMKYRKNGGAETAVTEDIEVATGDKVAFYGPGTTASYFVAGTYFYGSAQVKVYGNIMSLVSIDFADNKTLTVDDVFSGLFFCNSKLIDASGMLLPATTVKTQCYMSMFYGCYNMTAAPKELPASTLAESCYNCMFMGCTSLTTAPTLPATILAESCYQDMFNGCKSLTTAPELKAELVKYCYSHMFDGCTNLTTAYVKAAYADSYGECTSMFDGCTAIGTLHTTTGNKTSWENAISSSHWSTWTAIGDWND